MASDWIQSRDGAFQIQVGELIATIAICAEVWGLSVEELTPLIQSKHEFDQMMAEQAEQKAIYHETVAAKQAKREELESALRVMVRRINNHPGMTEELRQQMNLASPTRAATRIRMPKVTCPQRCPDNNANRNNIHHTLNGFNETE